MILLTDPSDMQAVNLINMLGNLNINQHILTSTRIALTVQKFQKMDKRTRTIAKNLLKIWEKYNPEQLVGCSESDQTEHEYVALDTTDKIRKSNRERLLKHIRRRTVQPLLNG